MNQIDPEKSLSLAPLVIRFGGVAILLELTIFASIYFYLRSKKRKTTKLIAIGLIIIILTLLITLFKSYLLVLPAYNLI